MNCNHSLDNPSNIQLSLIGLTETWLSHDSNLPFLIDNYDFVFKNRQGRVGGGVALYMPKTFNYVVHDNISIINDVFETLFIEIMNPGGKNIMVGVIYRPPNSNPREFLLQLSDLLRSPVLINKDCFLMGDFNINLFNHEHNNVSQEFLETLFSTSFLPLISKPTRVTNSSASLIDNIFSNIISHPDSYIVLSDLTDHYPIVTHYTLSQSINNYDPRLFKRKVTQAKLASLVSSLEHVDWSPVYGVDDANSSYVNF